MINVNSISWRGGGGDGMVRGKSTHRNTNIDNYAIFCRGNISYLLFDFYYKGVRQFLADFFCLNFSVEPPFRPLRNLKNSKFSLSEFSNKLLSWPFSFFSFIFANACKRIGKQAGAELGQAQLKLEIGFTSANLH